MKETIKVNGEIISFSILPRIYTVEAEIFKVHESKYGDINLHLISKSFGGWFRKPNEQDYVNARNWVDTQMKSIEKSNIKNQTP